MNRQIKARGVHWRWSWAIEQYPRKHGKPHPAKKERHVGNIKHGAWWVEYHCRYNHRHREKVGPKGLAESVYQERKTQIRLQNFCPKESGQRSEITFADAARDYLIWAKTVQQKKSSWTDEYRFKPLKDHFSRKLTTKITIMDVEALKAKLAERYANATVNRYLALLKHMFNRLKRHGAIERNPVEGVQMLPENNQRERVMTPEEEERLFSIIPEPYKSLCVVALHTGLRKNELLCLRWSDVNFHTNHIKPGRSKGGDNTPIPMNAVTRNTLNGIPRPIQRGSLIFPKCGNISHNFKKWTKEAGIVDLHLHDLRRTFGSRLAMQGHQILAIKKLLGHKAIQTTLRYSHLADSQLQRAVESLVPKPGEVLYKSAER